MKRVSFSENLVTVIPPRARGTETCLHVDSPIRSPKRVSFLENLVTVFPLEDARVKKDSERQGVAASQFSIKCKSSSVDDGSFEWPLHDVVSSVLASGRLSLVDLERSYSPPICLMDLLSIFCTLSELLGPLKKWIITAVSPRFSTVQIFNLVYLLVDPGGDESPSHEVNAKFGMDDVGSLIFPKVGLTLSLVRNGQLMFDNMSTRDMIYIWVFCLMGSTETNSLPIARPAQVSKAGLNLGLLEGGISLVRLTVEGFERCSTVAAFDCKVFDTMLHRVFSAGGPTVKDSGNMWEIAHKRFASPDGFLGKGHILFIEQVETGFVETRNVIAVNVILEACTRACQM